MKKQGRPWCIGKGFDNAAPIGPITPAAQVPGITEAAISLQVNGQSTLWQILLRNLIDNACRYSPDGATVRLHTQGLENGQIQITVQDSGPGLPHKDLARLGERFFRLPGITPTGSGLGWSIVRHIAALQHIDVQVGKSTDLGGLQVTLRFLQV
jgi:two-component system sensor histidine kinase QseC